jgi:hypothetical protein
LGYSQHRLGIYEQRIQGQAPLALAAPAAAPRYFSRASYPGSYREDEERDERDERDEERDERDEERDERDEESWANKVNKGDKGDDREFRRASILTSTNKQ